MVLGKLWVIEITTKGLNWDEHWGTGIGNLVIGKCEIR